jgi:hypothetical protein
MRIAREPVVPSSAAIRRTSSNPLSGPSAMSTSTTSVASFSIRDSASRIAVAVPTTEIPCASSNRVALCKRSRLSSTITHRRSGTGRSRAAAASSLSLEFCRRVRAKRGHSLSNRRVRSLVRLPRTLAPAASFPASVALSARPATILEGRWPGSVATAEPERVLQASR